MYFDILANLEVDHVRCPLLGIKDDRLVGRDAHDAVELVSRARDVACMRLRTQLGELLDEHFPPRRHGQPDQQLEGGS